MKPRILLGVAVLGIAAHAANAEPLAVKLGAWEITMTTQMAGDSTPQALLDKLTPEQRARHEERTRKRAAAGPRQTKTTSCVKKEDLERDAFGGREQKDCAYRMTTQTRNVHAATFECTGAGARKGEMRYEAFGGERMKGFMKMVTARGSMEMQMEGKWLGPVCKSEDE